MEKVLELIKMQKTECREKYDYSFSKMLRTYRAQHDISAQDFADNVNTTISSVSSWENERHMPSVSNACTLRILFGLHPLVFADILAANNVSFNETAFDRFMCITTYATGRRICMGYCNEVYGLTEEERRHLIDTDYLDFDMTDERLLECYMYSMDKGKRIVQDMLPSSNDIPDELELVEAQMEFINQNLSEDATKLLYLSTISELPSVMHSLVYAMIMTDCVEDNSDSALHVLINLISLAVYRECEESLSDMRIIDLVDMFELEEKEVKRLTIKAARDFYLPVSRLYEIYKSTLNNLEGSEV